MKILLSFVFLLWMGGAMAQQELEIIELRSTTVDRVLPALRPLLEAGGTLSGMNGQLFVRASATNRAEIRKAVAALDRPARQLIIRISRNRAGEDAGRGGAVAGTVTLGSSSRVAGQASVWDTRSVRSDQSGQMVRTQEGSPAFIQVGQSLALPMRQLVLAPGGAVVNETVVYRDVGQGFYALPTVTGERVSIEISQQAESLVGGRRTTISSQSLSTTVAGRLGEWIRLGGNNSDIQDRSNASGASTRELHDQNAIWLKVEEVQ